MKGLRGLMLAGAVLAGAGAAGGLVGCMGPGPVERTLLVDAGCHDDRLKPASAPALAVLPLEASAALDRRAVAIREDGALRSATTWSWEDSPRRLATQAVLDRLACSGDWAVVWPYRPRVEHVAVLGGRVEELSVSLQNASATVHLRLVFELWGRDKGPLLRRIPVDISALAQDASPGAVAATASQAVRQAMDQLEATLQPMRQALEVGHE